MLSTTFVHVSPPLDEILKVVNKESNNFYAEQVFRSVAPGGGAEAAERRVKVLLSKAGISADRLSIRDGSGLSRKNLVTPHALGRLLAYMRDHPESDAFVSSLPSGGEPQTTLRGRLHNVPVRAKTGSLEFVRALSGYTTTSDGRQVAFAVLANNFTGPSYAVTQSIDRVVASLASSSQQ